MRALEHRELERQAAALADTHADASVYCVDHLGATFQAVPDGVARHFQWSLTARSPIELMAADFRTDGADLFVECRRVGRVSGVVRLADAPDTDVELHLLNRGDCVVGVVVPVTSTTAADGVEPDSGSSEGSVAPAAAAGGVAVAAVAASAAPQPPRNAAFTSAVDAPAGIAVDEPPVAAPLTSRMILHLDAAGVIRDADSGAVAGLGRSREELIGCHLIDYMHPDDAPWASRSWAEMVSTVGGRRSFQGRYRSADGSVVVVDQADTNALDGPHNVVVCEMIDVTEAVTAQTRSRFQSALLDRVSARPEAALIFVDAQDAVEYRNPRWGQVTGLPADSAVAAFVGGTESPDEVDTALARAIRFGEASQQSVRFVDGAGAHTQGTLEIEALLGPTGERGALISIDQLGPAPAAPVAPVEATPTPPPPPPAAPASAAWASAPLAPAAELALEPVDEEPKSFPALGATAAGVAAVPGLTSASSALSGARPKFPDMPDVPGLSNIDASTPALDTPDLAAPNISFPEVPTPDINTPDLSAPDISAPEISAPSLGAPTLGAPDVSAPDVTVPELAVPEVSTPVLPSAALPEVETPLVAAPVSPTVEAPVPGSEVPGFGTSTQQVVTPESAAAVVSPTAPGTAPATRAWNDFWTDDGVDQPTPSRDVDFKQERSFGGTEPTAELDKATTAAPRRSVLWGGLGALLVTALAAAVRLFRLDSVPGAGRSQFEYLTEVESARIGDTTDLYSTVGEGQPSGPLHIRSWVSDLLPDGVFGARLLPAIVGTLTVLTLFLIVRRRFGDLAATISGALLAVMVWHVHYSRLDLGSIWWPLAVGLFLLFVSPLLERNTSRSWWRWLVAGIFLGVGSYVSNANWIVMATAVVAILLWALFRSGTARRSSLSGWLAMTAVSLLVALPMGRELISDESEAVDLFASNDPRLGEGLDWNSLGIIERITEGLTWWATTWTRISVDPEVDFFDGLGVVQPVNLIIVVLAVVGLLWSMLRARSGFVFLLVALTITLPLGAAFTADFSLQHSLPLALLLALFAGVGLAWILRTIADGFGKSGPFMATAVALAFAAVVGWISLTGYFDVFANDGQTRTLYSSAATDGVDAVAELGDDVFVNYYSSLRSFNSPSRVFAAPDLQGRDRSAEWSTEREVTVLADDDQPQAWVLFDTYLDSDVLDQLETAYPDGEIVSGGVEDEFLVFADQ